MQIGLYDNDGGGASQSPFVNEFEKERMKWQFQDITISIETNPTSRSE